jgi:glutamate carboxypeptidase
MDEMLSLDDPIPMRALLAGARQKQASLLSLTQSMVRIESPSDSKAAVDSCMDFAAAHAQTLGGRVKRHRQKQFGDVLELRFGSRRSAKDADAKNRILVLGHLDTVWPLGTLKSMPCRVTPDADGRSRLYGPGTLDMKAGVAMAFTALEILHEARLTGSTAKAGAEIVLLLNSEEEIGSPVSKPITEAVAQTCSAVYVLEPAQGLAYKTARKGTGNWRLEVNGVAAHAGVDFSRGRSAILELGRQIEKVSGWSGIPPGTEPVDAGVAAKAVTVNVGVMGGGTKSNVVPAYAWAEIDVRIGRQADGARMERRFAGLKPTLGSDCTLMLTGGINRPPMERTRGTVALFRRAQAFAAELGADFLAEPGASANLDEASTGGASDGNFTSALGVPTLDGMGAVGEGAHATHESVLIEHLAPRTALLAAMLMG